MQRRHFMETAKAVNYSPEKAEMILDEMLGKIDKVISEVREKIPHDFPKEISQPIFEGLSLAKQRLSS